MHAYIIGYLQCLIPCTETSCDTCIAVHIITMSSLEHQPLLPRLDSHSHIQNLSSDAIEEFLEHRPIALRWWSKLIVWESRLLWLLSGASIVVSIFNYMLSFVTLMFTGHLGSLELAGASVASVGIQGLAYGIMVCLFICAT